MTKKTSNVRGGGPDRPKQGVRSEADTSCFDLRHLADADLLAHMRDLVRGEREALTRILRHLNEVDRRKLFCELGYRSLFDYAVRDLGYSEPQASRRIQAMRLIREIPEVEAKVESGRLSLSNIVNAQTYFREVKRSGRHRGQPQRDAAAPTPSERADASAASSFSEDTVSGVSSHESGTVRDNPSEGGLSRAEKLAILTELEHKSAREGERILLGLQPDPPRPRERLRQVSALETEIRLVFTHAQVEKLEEVRALLGPQAAEMGWAELIVKMTDLAISVLEKQRYGKGRQRQHASHSPAHGTVPGDPAIPSTAGRSTASHATTASPRDQTAAPQSKTAASGPVGSPEEATAGPAASGPVGSGPAASSVPNGQSAPFDDSAITNSTPTSEKRCVNQPTQFPHPNGALNREAPSRYISPAVRRLVWTRDEGRCTNCGSRRNLNIDHRIPVARGGTSEIDNLRLLCFNCNQREAIKIFGVEACDPSRHAGQGRPNCVDH